MNPLTRRVAMAAGGFALAAATLAVPVTASAQPTIKGHFACGYDGYDGSNGSQPLYTHCGRGRVEIKVDHFFWQHTYFCAVPGTQEIPQGEVSWRIIGAEYDGKPC